MVGFFEYIFDLKYVTVFPYSLLRYCYTSNFVTRYQNEYLPLEVNESPSRKVFRGDPKKEKSKRQRDRE